MKGRDEGRQKGRKIKSRETASTYVLTLANDCQAILSDVLQIFCHRNFERASIVIRCARLGDADKSLHPIALTLSLYD